MRLFEIVQPQLYYCTDTEYASGVILRAPDSNPLGKKLETYLAMRKPEQAVPRTKCFYLSTEPITNARFVYLVSPVGELERNHLGWLALLTGGERPPGVLDGYARAYWSGGECFDEPRPGWSYRARGVKVVQLYDG